MSLDLNGISVFVTVADAGSFARAAEKRHLTRSAVGKTIARLESKLGIQLFQRTTRKQNLTVEGSLFYEHCRRALAEISLAEDLLNAGKLQVSGRLRVSVPILLGHSCIAPLLTELSDEHQDLQLEISFSDRMTDLVEEGFDLAIRIGALPDTSALIVRSLGKHRMVFCAAQDYLQRYGEPQSIDELSEHHAVAYIRSGIVQKWQIKDSHGNLRQITPKAMLLMDDMQAIANATVAGKGVAWLPYWLVRERLVKGELTLLMGKFSGVSFPINAVWPNTEHLPLKVRMAVDKLVTKLPAVLTLVEPSLATLVTQ